LKRHHMEYILLFDQSSQQMKIFQALGVNGRTMKFVFTSHALGEIERRNLSISVIEKVLMDPEQIIEEYGGRKVYQSKVGFEGKKIYLVRVIVEGEKETLRVITAYRSSKVGKYWRKS